MFLSKQSNGYYYIFFNNEITGKKNKVSCKTKNKSMAIKFVSEFKAYQKQLRTSRITQVQNINDLKTEILKYVSVNLQNSTCKIYNRVLNDMGRIIGDKSISLINSRDIEHYKTVRSAEVSASTVNIDINTMKAIFNIAIRLGWTAYNPVKGINKLSIPAKENLSFTDEQLKLIIDNADEKMKDIILTGLLTGCRLEEIINLQWQDINFNEGILKIRNKDNFKTKTGKIRDIPITEDLNKLFITMLNKKRNNNVIDIFNPESYIFTNPKGCIYNKSIISKKFKKLLRRLNIDERYHFHCLRHTYITKLIKSGININYVKEIAGHSVIQTTMNYIHISTDDLKRAVYKIKII